MLESFLEFFIWNLFWNVLNFEKVSTSLYIGDSFFVNTFFFHVALVGYRVLILWPDDMLWYKCRIVGYRRRPKRKEDRKNEDRKNEDGGENEHRVIYDDGEVRWHNLSQERYAFSLFFPGVECHTCVVPLRCTTTLVVPFVSCVG